MVLDYGMELKSELGEKGAQPGFCPLVNGLFWYYKDGGIVSTSG